ncbi:MAG: hypothetical protein PHP35_00370 [Candidatus Colwellbacteria bacterium]|nr:hypothetical protein [Candidatus Colwellbacteria bacterium]
MLKKIIGIILIILGLVALLTPFTPGSWLIFAGLEFLGLRILFWKKIRTILEGRKKSEPKN